MSEFEKRTLGNAINFFFFFVYASSHYFWRGGVSIVLCSAAVVVIFLYTFLGIWEIESKSGWNFREDNLTEREKFLSYKATSRTLTVFVIVSYTLVTFCLFTPISSAIDESTFRFHDGAIVGVIIFLAFAVAKSLVLTVYLRNERLRNSQTDHESTT